MSSLSALPIDITSKVMEHLPLDNFVKLGATSPQNHKTVKKIIAKQEDALRESTEAMIRGLLPRVRNEHNRTKLQLFFTTTLKKMSLQNVVQLNCYIIQLQERTEAHTITCQFLILLSRIIENKEITHSDQLELENPFPSIMRMAEVKSLALLAAKKDQFNNFLRLILFSYSMIDDIAEEAIYTQIKKAIKKKQLPLSFVHQFQSFISLYGTENNFSEASAIKYRETTGQYELLSRVDRRHIIKNRIDTSKRVSDRNYKIHQQKQKLSTKIAILAGIFTLTTLLIGLSPISIAAACVVVGVAALNYHIQTKPYRNQCKYRAYLDHKSAEIQAEDFAEAVNTNPACFSHNYAKTILQHAPHLHRQGLLTVSLLLKLQEYVVGKTDKYTQSFNKNRNAYFQTAFAMMDKRGRMDNKSHKATEASAPQQESKRSPDPKSSPATIQGRLVSQPAAPQLKEEESSLSLIAPQPIAFPQSSEGSPSVVSDSILSSRASTGVTSTEAERTAPTSTLHV